jgi:RND family efflux transporter MFP subunit
LKSRFLEVSPSPQQAGITGKTLPLLYFPKFSFIYGYLEFFCREQNPGGKMEKPNLQITVQQVQTLVRRYWYVPASVILLAFLFLLGSWYGQSKVAGPQAAGSRRILYYVDPMNPAHTSPEPGLAPCGMKMEPVYAENEGQTAGSAMPPGSVKITPEKQQVIGVRVAKVEKSPWTYTLRTVGKVAVDETRIYRLNAFTEGFIIRVYNNSTGSLVRRDEPLATLYNRDLVPTLQAYFYASDAMDRLRQGQQMHPNQLDQLELQKQSAELALINLGMSSMQFKELNRDKQITQEIILSAPVTSFVLARNITPGQKFNGGEELYRLADLSRVWILADLFENEARYIRPGEKVGATLPHQDEKFMATVSEVLPQFDPATLTLKVRLEMDNPKFALRPGMFMDVEFPINLPSAVNVPADAILDSGLKKTVFVDRGNGFFEPRRVKTGWRLGDRVEITEGLAPGESIVVSGNFLIDSESRMRLAAAGMFGEVSKDPVCGLNVDESKAKAAGFTNTFQNRTYYFCSEGCKQRFEKSPERLATTPGGVSETAGGAAGDKAPTGAAKSKDPVCGLEVDPAKVAAKNLNSEYLGKTYYFDQEGCKQRFDKDPQHYLSGTSEAALPQTYPNVPSDLTAPLRFKRNILRSIPQVPTQSTVPPGVTQAPQAPTQPTVPPGAAQVIPQAPQVPTLPTVPPGATQVAPKGPTKTMPPGATQAVPRGPSPLLPRGLRLTVPRGPTQEMRESAERGMREREAEAKRQGKQQAAPPGPSPAAPPRPAVKPQEQQTPPPAQAPPAAAPQTGGRQHD